MIRRFNYTGRKRINRDHVKIVLHEGIDASPKFDAKFDLTTYELPDDAIVFVEAYRQTLFMRFDFGTVAAVTTPVDRSLSEFESSDGILFRVKISSQSPEKGKLLAEADRIPFRRSDDEEEQRIPLLPVRSEDLGHQISKVDFTDQPYLLINSALGDWRSLALSPLFLSLVYPQILKEILTRIIRIEQYHDTDDPEDWRSKWLRFATFLPGISEPPQEDEETAFDDWVDDVIAGFCKRNDMLEKFHLYWKEGESE